MSELWGVDARLGTQESREASRRVMARLLPGAVEVAPGSWAHKPRPILLDLFSCAGGAAMGYHRAGFRVIGIDINPQPRYPFEFVQADLTQGIPWEQLAALGVTPANVAAVHASPPCQAHSWSAKRWINSGERDFPDLLEPTRAMLQALGKPYVIENVVGAPLHNPMTFSGLMFGLKVVRKRLFESNILLMAPPPHRKQGSVSERDYFTVAGHGGNGGAKLSDWKNAMGIDWMNKQELTQSIPPAYTEWIGRQLIEAVRSGVKLPPVANSTAAKSSAEHDKHQSDTHTARNAKNRKIEAGESQQLVMFGNEVANAYEKTAQGN